MKKYILLFGFLFCLVSMTWAQDDGELDEGYGPKAGDWTVEMQYGRSNVINSGLTLPSAPGNSGATWTVQANSPYANNITLTDNGNNFTNMIGLKGRYYVSDKISTILSGALRMDYTPGQPNVPGFISGESNAGWIPAYAAIPEQSSTLMNVNIGGEYTFSTEMRRVFPYIGVHVPFYYARQSEYDPTIEGADINGSTQTTVQDPNLIIDLGTRTGEIFAFGAQIVAGVDYYLMEGFYFGLEIRPASYIYAYSASKPGPGLELQQSNTNTYSFFTQPFMKIGFKF